MALTSTNAVWRICDIEHIDDHIDGGIDVTIVPCSDKARYDSPEVGDYFVVHKDNGPPEEEASSSD